MVLRLVVLCSSLLALCYGFVASAEVVPGEYLVRFKPQAFKQPRKGLYADLAGAELNWVDRARKIALVKPEASRLANGDVLDGLRDRPDVELVQPNYRYRIALHFDRLNARRRQRLSLFSDPTGLPEPAAPPRPRAKKPDVAAAPLQARAPDPLFLRDKNRELANAPAGWAIEEGSRDVIVAVIDTGVDYNHEDLAANMWHDPSDPSIVGWDFVDNDARPYDVTSPINVFTGEGNPGHGTHCAGNVGAVGDNGLGSSGIAKKVSLMALRMLDDNGTGDTAAGIKAIEYAVAHGARIISASWGTEGETDDDHLLKDAIARAESRDVLFVMAAGNTQSDTQGAADNDAGGARREFPASFGLPNIISVAASDQNGKMANFTHFGAHSVDLAAPGQHSLSTIPTDRDLTAYPGSRRYEDSIELADFGPMPWDGTSMATPQVAGAAALLLARHPDWTSAQIKKRLLDSVRPEPTFAGKTVTGGLLDVGKALAD